MDFLLYYCNITETFFLFVSNHSPGFPIQRNKNEPLSMVNFHFAKLQSLQGCKIYVNEQPWTHSSIYTQQNKNTCHYCQYLLYSIKYVQCLFLRQLSISCIFLNAILITALPNKSNQNDYHPITRFVREEIVTKRFN